MAEVASGKAGAAALMGPSSLMMRLTMPRAGRPVIRLVSAVPSSREAFSAVRCGAAIVDSGQNR